MLLNRRQWRRRPISLTPLIDIIFLLLLFFMLSSTFTRFAEVPLLTAGTGAPDQGPPLFLQLRGAGVVLNGNATTLAALPSRLEAYRDGDGGGATLLITLDGAVSSQRLVDLLAVLREMPWLSVAVLE